jgi:hypothetical protein
MNSRRRAEGGSAIALVLVIVIMLAGLAAALATVSFASNTASGGLQSGLQARYAAAAGIEWAKVFIIQSTYDQNGNTWLRSNSFPVPPTGAMLPLPNQTPLFNSSLGGSRVEVWVYNLDASGQNNNYRIVSRGTSNGVVRLLAQDIRARDTFARWTTFVDAENLHYVGNPTVKGKVHSNQNIDFHGGAGTFEDEVTSRYDFWGEGTTKFKGKTKRYADSIKMPTDNDIAARRSKASGVYDIHEGPGSYSDLGTGVSAKLEFKGNTVTIEATGSLGTKTYVDQPLPPDGVIYVQGDVQSVKGRMQGNVTVATTGKINITGPILYEDVNGNAAMTLYKDGVEQTRVTDINNNYIYNTGSDAWNATGTPKYTYDTNPNYSVPKNATPALGLMAGGAIEITDAAPYNIELHAALFSLNDRWFADTSKAKGNFRFVGAAASKKGGWRSDGTMGYSLSGEYVYDSNLMNNPPAEWLKVDQTFWGPRWEMTR